MLEHILSIFFTGIGFEGLLRIVVLIPAIVSAIMVGLLLWLFSFKFAPWIVILGIFSSVPMFVLGINLLNSLYQIKTFSLPVHETVDGQTFDTTVLFRLYRTRNLGEHNWTQWQIVPDRHN